MISKGTCAKKGIFYRNSISHNKKFLKSYDIYEIQSRKQLMGSNKIGTGHETLISLLCVIFSCYGESLISGKETRYCPPTNFDIFLIFPSFVLRQLVDKVCYTRNQTYTKMSKKFFSFSTSLIMI